MLDNGDMPDPPLTSNLHHEIEMVLALAHVFGYALGLGLDMTRRDLQNEAKKTGRP